MSGSWTRRAVHVTCLALAVAAASASLANADQANGPLANRPATGAQTATCGQWSVYGTGINDDVLNAVTALSQGAAYAVGGGSGFGTLIVQWDGMAWSPMPSPSPASAYDALWGVSALSETDIWAVGFQAKHGEQRTLAEHWDGARWKVVKTPNSGTGNNALIGVLAASTNDVWAVGRHDTSQSELDLIEHWNGHAWKVVKGPNLDATTAELDGVAGASSNDIWAVGFAGGPDPFQALALHWNGSKWLKVATPAVQQNSYLGAASAVSGADVWAAGESYGSSSSSTLAEHWDGTSWTASKTPNVGNQANFLYGVAMGSTSNGWAVGFSADTTGFQQTLTERWNGTKWSVVPSPDPGTQDNYLQAVANIPGTSHYWAVGSYQGAETAPLIEYYC